jgi:NADH-quinone oxidoreductase subunit C
MSDEEKKGPGDAGSAELPAAEDKVPEKVIPKKPASKPVAKKPLDPEAAKAKAEALRKKKEAEAAAEALKPPWQRNPVTPSWEDAEQDVLAVELRGEFGDAIEGARIFAGDLALEIERDRIAEVCASLREKHGFTYMVDLCGVDYPEREPRFEVVYQLHRFEDNRRIRLRVKTDEGDPVPTVSGVWRAAGWPEREVWDMYGVSFAGHADMTRILTWEGFNGHPLRKDFPVEGIDTGAAIYPERYDSEAGPVAGTGTGWMMPKPESAESEEES